MESSLLPTDYTESTVNATDFDQLDLDKLHENWIEKNIITSLFIIYENENGSFVIDWDPLNEFESQFNNWTEKDFIKAITDALQAFEEFEQEDLSSPEE